MPMVVKAAIKQLKLFEIVGKSAAEL